MRDLPKRACLEFQYEEMTLDMQCSIFFESVPKRKERLMLHNYF